MPDPTYTFDAQMLFAANMRRIRLSKTMTQEMVAEYAELHPNYISSVERGERNISIRNIAKIARALSSLSTRNAWKHCKQTRLPKKSSG